MAVNSIDLSNAAPAQPAPPITSLKSKVTRVALTVFVAVWVGVGAFLISSSLPVSLAAGIITLLLLCAWIYYLNRNAPPPVEVVPQAPPVVDDPEPVIPVEAPVALKLPEPVIPVEAPVTLKIPEPVTPVEVPVGLKVLVWQKKLCNCIESAKRNCTPEKVAAFRILLREMPDHINDPLQKNPFWGTILHVLAKNGVPEFVAVMAEYNVDFGIKEIHNLQNTALHWAIANGKNSTALEIIKHAPSQTLSIQGGFGNTPLHLAIAKGYTTVTRDKESLDCPNFALTQALIEKGASLNVPNDAEELNNGGNTPLHLACARRDIATMQLLIDKGAKTDVRNNQHQTPWDLIHLKYEQAYELLRDTAGAFALEKETFEKNEQEAENVLFNAQK